MLMLFCNVDVANYDDFIFIFMFMFMFMVIVIVVVIIDIVIIVASELFIEFG